jgi:photosystem II stability/assembly factor-like uncharacterized protein
MIARRVLTSIMLAVLLWGANRPVLSQDTLTVTPTPLPLATVEFLNTPFDPDGVQWMEEQADDFGLHFGAAILALDQDTAFLYGGLAVPAGTLRSLLLRTEDGGDHWQEVMEPVRGSGVEMLTFLDQGEGWALVLWVVEGAGPITLYHTTDYGLTWEELGEVPKWQWYGYPTRMTFTDSLHGQIVVIYDGGMPDTNRAAILTTTDGGQTWQETDSIGQDSPDPEAFATTVAPYYGRSFFTESTAPDGSVWRISAERGVDVMKISHRSSADAAEIVWAVPVHFIYDRGKIALSPLQTR